MIKYLVHWLEVLCLTPLAMTPHASGPNTLILDRSSALFITKTSLTKTGSPSYFLTPTIVQLYTASQCSYRSTFCNRSFKNKHHNLKYCHIDIFVD